MHRLCDICTIPYKLNLKRKTELCDNTTQLQTVATPFTISQKQARHPLGRQNKTNLCTCDKKMMLGWNKLKLIHVKKKTTESISAIWQIFHLRQTSWTSTYSLSHQNTEVCKTVNNWAYYGKSINSVLCGLGLFSLFIRLKEGGGGGGIDKMTECCSVHPKGKQSSG